MKGLFNKKNIYFVFTFLIVLLVLFFGFQQIKTAKAGSGDNVYGWAWSETVGWISFNSLNCDSDENAITDNGNYPQCPIGQPVIDYGVNVDNLSGNLSGYAWSEGIGWVIMNPAGPYPQAPNYSGCLDLPGNGQVCDGVGDWQVSGWARACSVFAANCSGALAGNEKRGGWDGWIKLKNGTYGVWVDTGPNPDEFKDWAWGSDIVGWMSFNCSNQGVCGSSDYKVLAGLVFNSAPTAINLNKTEANGCFALSPRVWLNWTFSDPDGDSQGAYHVQVDNNSDFSSPEKDTGKVSSSSESYAPDGLSFSSVYYWRLMVWDDKDKPSVDWIYPAGPFTTDPRWPDPDFQCNNQDCESISFTQGELIQFNNLTDNCGADPCLGACNYEWDFGDGSPLDVRCEPDHSYSTISDYTVTLTAQDGSRSCQRSYTLKIRITIPEWKEIAPF